MNSFILKIGRALNAVVRRSNWYSNIVFEDCNKFWNHKEFNLDVINLGSTSGVHSFNYNGLDIKAANFALSHNQLLGDEAVLMNYCSFLNPGKSTVIISLCPFSSLAGSYDYFDDRYYSILHSSSIPYFSKLHYNGVMHVKNRPIKYFPCYQVGIEILYWIRRLLKIKSNCKLTESQLEEDANNWIKGWKHEFSITSFDMPLSMINEDAINDSIEILNRIIAFCENRNIELVLTIPPVYHTLARKFLSSFREKVLDQMINGLKRDCYTFINYMEDEHFLNDRNLFKNSFLLNETGAKYFTQRVLTDIKLIKK